MSRALLWAIPAIIAVAAILWLAAPALSPFALAAVAAYIGKPLAAKLESRRLPPSASAAVVVFIFLWALILIPLICVPVIASGAARIAAAAPDALERMRAFAGEYLSADLSELNWRGMIAAHVDGDAAKDAAAAIGAIAGWFGRGASALLGFLITLLIAPLAAFYLLRDRAKIAAALSELLPAKNGAAISKVCGECDRVLGEFLHGQLAVMFLCALMYTALLKIAGLDGDLAFAVGGLSGILTFIPYAGFGLALIVATVAAVGQFGEWAGIAGVWAAMFVGTAVESFLLTPKIIGERVGLHPVFVLLALAVAGELMGFFGVLIALPLAAIVLTLAREARRRYRR